MAITYLIEKYLWRLSLKCIKKWIRNTVPYMHDKAFQRHARKAYTGSKIETCPQIPKIEYGCCLVSKRPCVKCVGGGISSLLRSGHLWLSVRTLCQRRWCIEVSRPGMKQKHPSPLERIQTEFEQTVSCKAEKKKVWLMSLLFTCSPPFASPIFSLS